LNLSKSFEDIDKNERDISAIQKSPGEDLSTFFTGTTFKTNPTTNKGLSQSYYPGGTSSPVTRLDPRKYEAPPIKEETFEEITESKDIVQDKINRLKLQMVDFTMRQ
jgi:hypothetical protein